MTCPGDCVVKVQGPVPEQAPIQPRKREPRFARACRTTCVPGAIVPEQEEPDEVAQLTPDGVDETVPAPLPTPTTVTLVASSKRAVAVNDAATVNWHVARPVQAPLHPTKTEPGAGCGVRVMRVDLSKTPTHIEPQSTPEMLLAMVP